jgi:hypothetical protein
VNPYIIQILCVELLLIETNLVQTRRILV